MGHIAETLDAAIAAGTVRPLLVVMPMGGNSWYVDDADPGGAGPMARALTTDLVRAIDLHYPTVACRSGRAIGGLSMGGYGALLYAFDRPDLYAAAISLSGSIFREMPEDAEARRLRFTGMFGSVFGDPFDWRRFNGWNLFPRVARLRDASALPAVWLEAGDTDFLQLLNGSVALHIALLRAGAESELRVLDGGHEWPVWAEAIGPALAWLSPRLDAACAD